MKLRAAAVVLVALPLFVGMHCRQDCASKVVSPIPVSLASRPAQDRYLLEPNKLYELRLAAGVVVDVSAEAGSASFLRDVGSTAACAAIRESPADTVVVGAGARQLPPARAVEPFAFPLLSANGVAPEVMSERIFLAAVGEAPARLVVRYGGTRPAALSNENVHGQCLDVPYVYAVDPVVVPCR